MNVKENPFEAKDYSEVLAKGLEYINDRRQGRVKSFKTPWTGLNHAGINGLEWGSMLTIGARPGAGKLREARIHNPGQDFSILEFQFEMGDKQYAARQFAAEVAQDYDQVLSSYKQLDEFAYRQMQKYLEQARLMEKQGIQRKLIKKPLSPDDIEKAIRYYFEAMQGKPMLITIDHSWLIKRGSSDKDKFDVLYRTAEMLMQVKNDLPIIVMMITQMNRTMEETARLHPGVIGNYPTSSDIFGGDALMQSSDMVVAINRPFKSNINIYGPKKYIVQKEHVYMHLLKVRNGSEDNNLLFLQGDFKNQRMLEVPEPNQATNNGSSGYIPYGQGGGSRSRGGRQVSADVGQEL